MSSEVALQNGWSQLRRLRFLLQFCAIFRRADLRYLGWVRFTGQSIVSSIALSMGSIFRMCQSPGLLTAAYHPALLYYDYALTLDLECRLFWSRRGFGQWGSLLFFLNRYCGILGHVPFVMQKFVRPKSALYLLCQPVHPYRQALAFTSQSIIGCMLP